MNTIKVLDHGKVELVHWMGGDLFIVQKAQSSFGKISTEYGEREKGILRSLMREEHGVPFEHTVLSYMLKMPIFVARQLVKHRVSSWSEHSARYSLAETEFYVPHVDGGIRTQTGKPMEYRYDRAETTVSEATRGLIMAETSRALKSYHDMIEWGVAREQARMVLPTNIYTTVSWTLNVRSLLNVLHLRNDEHAQAETREYAIAMEKLAWKVIPDTLEAFTEFGRKVP